MTTHATESPSHAFTNVEQQLSGELSVAPEFAKAFGAPGQFFTENTANGRFYSKYGSMSAWMYVVPFGLQKMLTGKSPVEGERTTLLALNLFNWALSIVVAWLLFDLTLFFFPGRATLAAGLVLAEFYATFLWNYLRVQNSEIFQILFFLLLMRFALPILRGEFSRRTFVGVWLSLLALVLTKISFIPLVLIFLGAWILFEREQNETTLAEAALKIAKLNALPLAALIAFVATLNTVKFGSPLLTGYHQWRPEIHALNGDITESIWALFFSPQWSLWVHFPVAVFAFFAWPAFFKRARLFFQ